MKLFFIIRDLNSFYLSLNVFQEYNILIYNDIFCMFALLNHSNYYLFNLKSIFKTKYRYIVFKKPMASPFELCHWAKSLVFLFRYYKIFKGLLIFLT